MLSCAYRQIINESNLREIEGIFNRIHLSQACSVSAAGLTGRLDIRFACRRPGRRLVLRLAAVHCRCT